MQIEIASHLVVTSERPMDNLHNLRVTYLSKYCIYGSPAVCQHLSLVGDDPIDYESLLLIFVLF